MSTSAPASTLTGEPGADAVDQAIGWMVRLRSGEADPREWDAWRDWQQAAPDHARAWERVQAIQGQLGALPVGASSHTFEAARRDVSRRRALRVLGVAGLVGGTGWLAAPWWSDAALLADLRTGTGERRRHELPDGTVLWLDTDSAVDIAFSAEERRLVLRRGQVQVTTGPDTGAAAYRPLIVHTPQGSAQALGTRFLVHRDDDDRTEVVVLEHAVELRDARGLSTPLRLRAGERATMDAHGLGPATPADADADAWTEGLLVARDMRLADFTAALGRYRPGRLACDAAVAELRVSGVFPLADTDAALALLTRTRPVRARALTRWWVTLAPR